LLGLNRSIPVARHTVRKDAVVPNTNRVVIIKPETKSGARAAAKRARLMEENGYDPERVFYDPFDPAYQPGSPTYIGPGK